MTIFNKYYMILIDQKRRMVIAIGTRYSQEFKEDAVRYRLEHPEIALRKYNSMLTLIVHFYFPQMYIFILSFTIYEYQADCDGEWGEILFDFENGTEEIIRLADWDTMKTNRFTNKAIAYLLNCENEKLPKETMVAFEL